MTSSKTTGAVLVLGGGVGGIQAALDLADSGFKVYLVERRGAIGGTVVAMLRRIDEKFRAHNRTAVDIESHATHEIVQSYPIVALQQIIYNAVFHRTYESTNSPVRVSWFNDRIEILSPGGPYGNVTTENFGQPGITDYRNPNIGGVLKTYGFIQAFGRGIATAQRAMEKNGNPKIEFTTNQSVVLCTLRRGE